MITIQAIIEIVNKLLSLVSLAVKAFTKTSSEKLEASKEELRKQIDEFKNSGRPKQ